VPCLQVLGEAFEFVPVRQLVTFFSGKLGADVKLLQLSVVQHLIESFAKGCIVPALQDEAISYFS
jgi:hypothetical protein